MTYAYIYRLVVTRNVITSVVGVCTYNASSGNFRCVLIHRHYMEKLTRYSFVLPPLQIPLHRRT